MKKEIPGRHENEGFFAYVRRLTNEFPSTSINIIRNWAKDTSRIRCSSYIRHYGKQACARNLRHLAAGTHGL